MREKALLSIYDPHHERLTAAVDEILREYGECLIIDGHSFCNDLSVGANLPDFCIGADDYHTPERLIETAYSQIEDSGYSVAINYPYSGAIVPIKHYRTEKRVISLMLEVNKGLYLKDGTMEKSDGFQKIKQLCDRIIRELVDCNRERNFVMKKIRSM